MPRRKRHQSHYPSSSSHQMGAPTPQKKSRATETPVQQETSQNPASPPPSSPPSVMSQQQGIGDSHPLSPLHPGGNTLGGSGGGNNNLDECRQPILRMLDALKSAFPDTYIPNWATADDPAELCSRLCKLSSYPELHAVEIWVVPSTPVTTPMITSLWERSLPLARLSAAEELLNFEADDQGRDCTRDIGIKGKKKGHIREEKNCLSERDAIGEKVLRWIFRFGLDSFVW
ncbi:hypothetical protein BKA64DRAFT_648595 [Cadophora sp. MPI-SDFR-AT-0126]|nr:hypothetical protein BKA64DRAFT_648595 [Leotiomycetes sp. MPI-SDFR-AT-0126]